MYKTTTNCCYGSEEEILFGEIDNIIIYCSYSNAEKKRDLIMHFWKKKIQVRICKWYLPNTWSVLGSVWIGSREIVFLSKRRTVFLLSEKCIAPRAIIDNDGSDRFEIFFKTFGRPLVDKITAAIANVSLSSSRLHRNVYHSHCDAVRVYQLLYTYICI